MSWELMLAARSAPVKHTARHVLMVIASHANRAGHAWPSIETVAAETGLGVSTVRRTVRDLEVSGVVDVIHRKGRSSEFVFPQLPHPAHSDHHPAQSDQNPAQIGTHKGKKGKKGAAVPAAPFVAAAGEEEGDGPVDVRALVAGLQDQLHHRDQREVS